MLMTTDWWQTPQWQAYERAYGDEPGTRSRLLAGAKWRTRVIDLAQDEAVLWSGVRRSYHALIHRLERRYGEAVKGDENWLAQWRDVIYGSPAPDVIVAVRHLHRLAAGRETRGSRTWELMGDWLASGAGLIVIVNDPMDGAEMGMDGFLPLAGYVYFIVHYGWAYYASAASLAKDVNIGLVWWALLALRARGVRYLEMGYQGQATDQKGRNIEFFRRGFGGVDVMVRETMREIVGE